MKSKLSFGPQVACSINLVLEDNYHQSSSKSKPFEKQINSVPTITSVNLPSENYFLQYETVVADVNVSISSRCLANNGVLVF